MYVMKKISPYALMLSIICAAIVQPSAQVVECKFDYCAAREGSWDAVNATCYYKVCDDGVPRTSDSKNKPYSCRGSKRLFAKKPNCKEVLAEERRAEENRRRQAEEDRRRSEEYFAQQQREQKEMERRQKMYEDTVIAERLANWLTNQIPGYIDKVNAYLVNGNDPVLANLNLTMNDLDPQGKRLEIYYWGVNNSADPIMIKQPSNGYGIEFYIKENLNKGSCQKGLKVVLNVTLKKGMQDDVVDGCDFWDNCEKKEGLVIDKAVWNVPGKSLCATELRKRLSNNKIDTRKKLR